MRLAARARRHRRRGARAPLRRAARDRRRCRAGAAKSATARARASWRAGELMATELGARFLRRAGARGAAGSDARTHAARRERRGASAKASVLSATCSFAPDARSSRRTSARRRRSSSPRDSSPATPRATPCCSAAAARTPRRPISRRSSRAQRLEIWTDVPGMFSANPRSTPSARLLRTLHYDEAQEIATSGAKVLHPRCILPARQYGIPLHVYATQAPDLEGTVLSAEGGDGGAQVKAVCTKKGITLISLDSPGMWHQVGFLADAFQVFKQHGMSVDLVSTSETNVTVSLDPAANSLDNTLLERAGRGPVAPVPRAGDRPVRLGEPRRAQHPRDPASARRRLRVLRRAEDLPGEPGRQRSELHLRGR